MSYHGISWVIWMTNTIDVCVLEHVFETKISKTPILSSFSDWGLFCSFRMYILCCFVYNQLCFMCINPNFMYVAFNSMYIINLVSTFWDNVQSTFVSVPLEWFDVHLQISTVHHHTNHVQKPVRGCTL